MASSTGVTAIPELQGAYVYQDLCEGELRWLRRTAEGGTVGGLLGAQQEYVLGFWQDADGELELLTAFDGIFRLVPADATD